jgi:hypothetical protein
MIYYVIEYVPNGLDTINPKFFYQPRTVSMRKHPQFPSTTRWEPHITTDGGKTRRQVAVLDQFAEKEAENRWGAKSRSCDQLFLA